MKKLLIILLVFMSSCAINLAPMNTCGRGGCPTRPNTMADILPEATPAEKTVAGALVFGLGYLFVNSMVEANK